MDGAVCLTLTASKISDENANSDCCDPRQEDDQDAVFLLVQVNHGHLSSAPGQISVRTVTVTDFCKYQSMHYHYYRAMFYT